MKGITPVITTVLLLLMAVAAVGGAWVWYQRMQTSAMAGGSGQVDQLKQTAVTISVDTLRCSSNSNYTMTLANIGTESVTLTSVTLTTSSGNSTSIGSYSSWAVSANSLDTKTTSSATVACSAGTTYYVSGRIGAQYVIRDFPVIAK